MIAKISLSIIGLIAVIILLVLGICYVFQFSPLLGEALLCFWGANFIANLIIKAWKKLL